MPSPFYAARRATYLSHYPFPRFRRFRYVVAVPEPRSPIISGFRAPENHVIARKNGRKRKQRCGPLAPQGHYPQMRNPEAWSLGKTAATTQTTALLCRPHPFAGTSASRDRFPPEVHAEALAAVVIVNKCITASKKQIAMDRYFRVVPPLAARPILRVRNPPIAIEKAEQKRKCAIPSRNGPAHPGPYTACRNGNLARAIANPGNRGNAPDINFAWAVNKCVGQALNSWGSTQKQSTTSHADSV
jgi:hypothetical protein